MNKRQRYSWEEPKDPFSFDILDVTPTPERFRALAEEAEVLSGRLHTEAGVMKVDVSGADLARLGLAYERLGRLSDVEYVLSRAVELDDGEGIDHDRIAWTIWRARLMFRQGSPRDAHDSLQAELARAREAGAKDGVSELLTTLALIDLADLKVERALDRLDESFRLARETKSTPAKAHALSAVGIAYALRPAAELEALDILNRAALLHQRTGDGNSLARVYNNIGAVVYGKGVYFEAIPYLELGLDFGASAPDLLMVINSISNNIRAYELYHERDAGPLREALVPLVELLPNVEMGRLEDQTMLPLGEVLTSRSVTYRTDPVLREAVVFLSMQPTRSLGPHREATSR